MNRRCSRRLSGQSLVELAAGVMVIIPVVLVLIDLTTIVLGVNMNNGICRDAARAASSGPPDKIQAGQPKQRAEAVVRKTAKPGGAVRVDNNVVITETVREPVPTQPFGGPVDGEVTVQTTVHIYPPFIVSAVVGSGGMDFTTSQTFPYTWVMENAVASNNGGAGGGGGGVGKIPGPGGPAPGGIGGGPAPGGIGGGPAPGGIGGGPLPGGGPGGGGGVIPPP